MSEEETRVHSDQTVDEAGHLCDGAETSTGSPNKDQLDGCDDMKTRETDTVRTENVAGGIDRLLQRHRNEIMFELRRLQYGDRPVTGQDNRQVVQNFLDNVVGSNSSNSLPPAGTHRSEQVTVEVEALIQRRPVSSILESAQFRRGLERAVRGAVNAVTARTPANIGRYRRPVELTDGDTAASRISRTSSPVNAVATPAVAATIAATANDADSVDLTAEERLSNTSSRNGSGQLPAVTQLSTSEIPTQLSTLRTSAWLQQHIPNILPGEQYERYMEETIEQMQREDLIMDIGDLIQRHLVSSMLSGNFRGVLERQMQRRLESSGSDGEQVRNAIQRLPRTMHRRNDFFDMNLPAGSHHDGLDEVSVISATAAVSIPQAYAQNSVVMSREIHSLKSQMEELKNMMRVMFDLQLDTQRSIRQEVAAALNPSNTTTEFQPPPSFPVQEGQCLICLEKAVDTVIYQCGHMCLCNSCALQLRSRRAHCPVCRAPVKDIIRAYRSN